MITIREFLQLFKRSSVKVNIYSVRNQFIAATTTGTFDTLKDSILDINVSKWDYFDNTGNIFNDNGKIEIYIEYEFEED